MSIARALAAALAIALLYGCSADEMNELATISGVRNADTDPSRTSASSASTATGPRIRHGMSSDRVGAATSGGTKTADNGGRRHVQVRAAYVNDIACIPLDLRPTDRADAFAAECWSGSAWNGGWNGRTFVHLNGTFDSAGRITAHYEETFIGYYGADGGFGTIRMVGWITIDENQQFTGRARIVGGDCDFAGSSGTVTIDGFATHGGIVIDWVRPTPPPADSTDKCDIVRAVPWHAEDLPGAPANVHP